MGKESSANRLVNYSLRLKPSEFTDGAWWIELQWLNGMWEPIASWSCYDAAVDAMKFWRKA